MTLQSESRTSPILLIEDEPSVTAFLAGSARTAWILGS